MFGGAANEARAVADCPVTGKVFETTISVPANEEFVGIVKPSSSGLGPEAARPTTGAQDEREEPQSAEYDDWLKVSRDYGVDFSKTMLTASSGAVAVYFAVLNYLGTTKVARSFGGALSVVPPVLFLVATAIFALALRPRLAHVGRAGFATFRDSRLRQLNLYISIGTAVFIIALIVALIVFAHVMRI